MGSILSGLSSRAEVKRAERKPVFSVKKPKSPHDSIYTFWFRALIACVCVIPAWIFIFCASLLNGGAVSSWIIALAAVIFIIPLIISERIRQSLFERILTQKQEIVDFHVDLNGIKISDADERLISSINASKREKNSTFFYRNFGKRTFDILATLMALVPALPIILLLAIILKMTGSLPFYSQMRVGRNGKPFRLWKFRTMANNPDYVLAKHLNENKNDRVEWDTTQRLKHDPRITNLGRLLRRTSLDELPQIYNVLKGDMSLVGPRPILLDHAQLYPGADYYSLRPGITGLWQISDRNNSSLAARASFDSHYAESLSFLVDMKIIVKTIGVVLRMGD